MNTRNLIRAELNGLLLVTAETYNDLIPEDISEQDLELIATTIEEARQTAEDNLVGVTQEVIKETTALVQQAQAKKESRLSKLLPKDVAAPPVAVPEVRPILPTPVVSKPVLEGPVTPPPRMTGTVEPLTPPRNIMEATEKALERAGSGIGAAGLVEMDFNEDGYGHDLGLTIDQENRLKSGIPLSSKKPPKVFGVYEASVTQPAQTGNSTGQEASALRQIKAMVAPYVSKTDNEALQMLASNILAIAKAGLGEAPENF